MLKLYIGGWDCESNREIVFVSFVRACVRAGGRGEAKLCARVRRCCFRGWVAAAEFVLRGVAWRGVSSGSLARWIGRWLVFGVYRVPIAPRTPGASRRGLQIAANR